METCLPNSWTSGSVTDARLQILQVSTADILGGAERVAWSLCHAYRERGHNPWLAVGYKQSSDPAVLLLPNHQSLTFCGDLCRRLRSSLQPLEDRVRGIWRIREWLNKWASPRREIERRLGIEDFNYPATHRLLELPPQKPDILHCHNLHGSYFDLRALPSLSLRIPTILTLHDAWLLSGHCAHSFACERWKTGCGECPDLSIYPAIRRDATAYNWRRKRSIYTNSQLFVATPCQWLMQKVVQSVLAPAIVEARIIPNGVDLGVFRPSDRQAVRAMLSVPQDAKVLLFTANGIRNNIWKDFRTMRAAITRVADRLQGQIVLFALGEDAPAEHLGHASVRFVPYQGDPLSVARYYQAADIYLHSARADTFPTTVLEALACGTPVVATAVGGIPEQVKGLDTSDRGFANSDLNRYGMDEATGVLVSPGDAEGMAVAIEHLLKDDSQRHHLGTNAARDAAKRFDLQRQADEFLTWYQEIVATCSKEARQAQ